MSKEGFELVQKTLLKKGFIEERGFKEIIPPFKEVIEKIGWIAICKHLLIGRAAIVREFYANLRERKETQCYVRGKWVPFDRHTINHICGLGKMSDGATLKRLKKDPDYQKIPKELTDRKGQWEGNKKTPYVKIAREDLTKKVKVWFYFLNSMLTPTKHVCTVRLDKVILLYAILKGYKISFGKIIEKSILEYQSNNFFGCMPHPSIKAHLCINGGVTFDKDE